MASKPIIIAYGGTLSAHKLSEQSKFNSLLKKAKSLFWTYNNDIIDQTTRSAWTLIRAIEDLKSKKLINIQSIHIHFWGDIDEEYNKIIKELGLNEYFTIEGFKTKKETKNILNRADLLFLPLESSKNKQKPLFIPGKFFEYLSIKKPILLLAEKESECATIALESGLGLLCNPRDWNSLSKLLLNLINQDIQVENTIPNDNYIQSFSFKEKTRELAMVFDEMK